MIKIRYLQIKNELISKRGFRYHPVSVLNLTSKIMIFTDKIVKHKWHKNWINIF